MEPIKSDKRKRKKKEKRFRKNNAAYFSKCGRAPFKNDF